MGDIFLADPAQFLPVIMWISDKEYRNTTFSQGAALSSTSGRTFKLNPFKLAEQVWV